MYQQARQHSTGGWQSRAHTLSLIRLLVAIFAHGTERLLKYVPDIDDDDDMHSIEWGGCGIVGTCLSVCARAFLRNASGRLHAVV